MSNVISTLLALEWRQPLWLLASLQPLLLWFVLSRLQNAKHSKFADSHLLRWITVNPQRTLWQRVFSRNVAYALAWVLLSLALAGPRLADNARANEGEGEGRVDIMLVVDVSASMKATDIEPSRIQRASLEIYELLSLAKNIRVGITVYAARPHLFVPLTTDLNAVRFYLKDLDTLQLPTNGSVASTALAFAQEQLSIQQNDRRLNNKPVNPQAIIWLTDGDIETSEIEKGKLEATLKQAQSQSINTYIMGIATSEGSGIPLADGSWVENKGQGVISKMDAPLLQQLAVMGGGKYTPVSDDESDWNALYYQGVLSDIGSKTKLSDDKDNSDKPNWKQYYHWFLYPAVLLLLLALFPFSASTYRPFNKVSSSNTVASFATLLTLWGVLLILAINPTQVFAQDASVSNTTVNDSTSYSSYTNKVLNGIEAYQGSRYSVARGLFIKAVLAAESDVERGVALHNLGNVLFQQGDYANAAAVFSDALGYNPKQQQSKKNQKLTHSLHQLLEKRRDKAQLKRENSSTAEDGTLADLPSLSSSTMSTQAVNKLAFSLPQIPKAELDILLQKGMDYLHLVQGDNGDSTQLLKKKQQAINNARLYLLNIESSSSSKLWKRLFEVEEGFPAKLKQPEDVPGVIAW